MDQPPPQPTRSRWSLSLSNVLLIVAAIAVWVAYFDVRAKAERTEIAVKALKARSRDLEVDDPLQFAVRKRPAKLFGGHEWQVHLPVENDSYQLNVAIPKKRSRTKKQSFEEFRCNSHHLI